MATQKYFRVPSPYDSEDGLIPPEHFATYRSKSGVNYFWRFCLFANFLLFLCNFLFTIRRFDYHAERSHATKNADYSTYAFEEFKL